MPSPLSARFRVTVLAAALAATACACGVPVSQADAPTISANQVAGIPAPEVTPALLTFGAEHKFASGVAISVSMPKSFSPSSTAYPPSSRATAFEIGVRNDGQQPYRLSKLSVGAEIAGTPVKQVVDATQGFNGVVDAGQDVAPGRTVRLTLAFAMPANPAELSLKLHPDNVDQTCATFAGSA